MAKNQTEDSRKFAFKKRSKIHTGFNLIEALDLFIAEKKLERRSDKTIKSYTQVLGKFCEWFADSKYNELNEEAIREYVRYMTFDKVKWDDHPTNHSTQKGVSARSINNIIRVLRVFFNFLINRRYISTNPAEGVKFQTEANDTFEVFTDDDVVRLLSAPNIKTFIGFRDYVMMLILIDTGLRIGELTSLRIKDVDFTLRQITIRGETNKSNRTRILPLSKKTVEEIKSLADYINVELDDYLFLTSFGERYNADTFAKMLKKYAKKVEVTDVRVSPHTFRHYFAIKYLRSGGNSFSLMKILGHTDISMTQRYVKYAETDVKENHQVASPVANLFEESKLKKRRARLYK